MYRNDVFSPVIYCMAVKETKNTYLYPPSPFLYRLVLVVASFARILAKLAWFIFHESFGMNRRNNITNGLHHSFFLLHTPITPRTPKSNLKKTHFLLTKPHLIPPQKKNSKKTCLPQKRVSKQKKKRLRQHHVAKKKEFIYGGRDHKN